MPACVVYGCTNRSDCSRKCKGITFHSFPLNPTRKALWVNAVRRKDWKPNKHSKICSQHFQEEDIDRTSVSSVRIRENAVPSIFPAYPPHLQEKERKRPPPAQRQKATKTTVDLPTTSGTHCEVSSLAADTLSQCLSEEHDEVSVVVKKLKRDVSFLSTKNKEYKKKIKVLQQSKRRLRKKVTSLSSVIDELRKKNLVDKSGLSVLESIPGLHKELLQRQAAKANCQSVPRTYEPEPELRSAFTKLVLFKGQ